MFLKQKIKDDVLQSLKEKQSNISLVLRMTLSAINSKEKEKRYKASKQNPNLSEEDLIKKSELEDAEIIDVLSSEIKKRKDAIVLFQKGNRQELAEKEQQEITILQKYLPEQLSQVKLQALISESIQKTGAKEMKDMGKVMADLAPKVKGKADNSEISKMVKQLLS